jgi:hypothetical protein
VIRIDGRVLFLHFADGGAPGPAIECGTKLGKLVRWADGVDFDAAVRQISCVAFELQAFGGALREVAKADTLHISGDEVAFGLFELAHKTVDCNREDGGRVEDEAMCFLTIAVSFTGVGTSRRLLAGGPHPNRL